MKTLTFVGILLILGIGQATAVHDASFTVPSTADAVDISRSSQTGTIIDGGALIVCFMCLRETL